jgi:hypothetical protein
METGVEPMKKSSLANHERYLKWERQKIDRAVKVQILEKAELITETLLDIGINDRNPNVLNSLLDRAFGKAAQSIVHEGNPDNPIVFMPAVLMDKYQIPQADYTQIEEEPTA